MRDRPDGFLAKELIDHDSEQFSYIVELHGYLWRMVRTIIPGAAGVLDWYIDKAIKKLEQGYIHKDDPITDKFPCKECGGTGSIDGDYTNPEDGIQPCPNPHCHGGMVEMTLCAVEVGINPEYFNKVEIVTILTRANAGEHRDKTLEWRVM